MNFKDYSKTELKAISSKGGKSKKKVEPITKTFEEVVKENITNEDLKDLYKGLMISAKKGNAKAIDILLKAVNEIKEEEPTSLDEFINEGFEERKNYKRW